MALQRRNPTTITTDDVATRQKVKNKGTVSKKASKFIDVHVFPSSRNNKKGFCVAYSRTMASSDLFIYLFVHESTRVSHVVLCPKPLSSPSQPFWLYS